MNPFLRYLAVVSGIPPKFTLWLSFLPLAAGLLLLLIHSPLLAGWSGEPHIDAQVYLYTAHEILRGKMLYLEVFDHKGPGMHGLTALGLLLGGGSPVGVWVLLLMLLGLSFFLLHRDLAAQWGHGHAIGIGGLALAWLYRHLSVGELCPETFAVVMMAPLVLLASRQLRAQNPSARLCFAAGFCAVALLSLKLNFGVLALLLLPAFVQSFRHCTTWHVPRKPLLAGFLAAALPLLFFVLFWPGARFAIWDVNISYVQNALLSPWQSIRQLFPQPILLLLMCSLPLLALRRKSHLPAVGLGLYLIFVLGALVGLPGRGAESKHYLLPMAPVLYVWAGLLPRRIIAVPWLLLLLALYLLRPILYTTRHHAIRRADPEPVLDWLKARARPDHTLQVLGNRSLVYLRSGISPACRIFYTWPLLHGPGPLADELNRTMRNNPPHWLYIDRFGPPHDSLQAWLKAYRKVQQDSAAELFERVVPSPQQ